MSPANARKTPLSSHQIRKVSVEAPADPRTIRKMLRGEQLSPMTAERIRRAIDALGLAHLIRTPQVGQ